MSTQVLYAPQQRLLDLANLTEQDFALISSLRHQISRGDRTLLCWPASADDGAEMFVRLTDGRYSAVHFAGSDCRLTHAISRESDEHRRQKDYWQRAADDAGYRTSQKFRTSRGTVLDVAIEGPRSIGIQMVQPSALEPRLAKSRTTKSFRAGWLPIWFLDSATTPEWFHQVPALGCNVLPWSSLPARHSATALGPSRFIAHPCTASSFGTCPTGTGKRPRRPCGEFHPKREPWRGLTVDDVAAMIPAEEIVPMRDLRGAVHLVAPANLALFQDITGLSGDYRPGNAPTPVRAAVTSTTCPNSVPSAVRSCSKCDRAPAGAGGVLCPACLHLLRSRPMGWHYGDD